VVDLAPSFSEMMSLLCRVYGMVDVLEEGGGSGDADGADDAEYVHKVHGADVVERGGTAGRAGNMGEYEVVMKPTVLQLRINASIMEVAVLTLQGELLDEVSRVFPSAGLANENRTRVTCVMTMQPRQHLDFDSMDSSLGIFLRWEEDMTAQLGDAWYDSVDPKTGRALRGTTGTSWSEVRAFHTFFKYPVDDKDVCPMIVHPVYGSNTYPVSFFTTATPQACITALQATGRLERRVASDNIALRVENETIRCGADLMGRTVLTGLNLDLELGRHVLITGPNGSGKTTLVRHLCQRLQTSLSPYSKQYMYLPQMPLIAPGRLLWQQLAYPGDCKPREEEMAGVLERVGLGSFLASLPDGLTTMRDWGSCLSFGEQQRLCIARVCLRKPAFAFLDEAFSGMDAGSAVRMIREVQKDSTVVLVSHDVASLEGLFVARVDLA